MRSLGLCPYEFMAKVTYRDIRESQGTLSSRAVEVFDVQGLSDSGEYHYAKVCLLSWGTFNATVSVALLPYGSEICRHIATVHADTSRGLLEAILSHLYIELGPRVVDNICRKELESISEWVDSATASSESVKDTQRTLF